MKNNNIVVAAHLPDVLIAERMANALIKAKLATCANIGAPYQSLKHLFRHAFHTNFLTSSHSMYMVVIMRIYNGLVLQSLNAQLSIG